MKQIKSISSALFALILFAGASNAQRKINNSCVDANGKPRQCFTIAGTTPDDPQPSKAAAASQQTAAAKAQENPPQPDAPEPIYVDANRTWHSTVITPFLEDGVRAGKFGNYRLVPERKQAHYVLFGIQERFEFLKDWWAPSAQGLRYKGISVVLSGRRDVGAILSNFQEHRVSMKLMIVKLGPKGEEELVSVRGQAAPTFTIERFTPQYGRPLVFLKDADIAPLLEKKADGFPVYPSLIRSRTVRSENIDGQWQVILEMLALLDARQTPVTAD